MIKNTVYDAVVYGSGASAFAAACTLGSMKFKTVLVTPDGFVGSEMSKNFFPCLYRDFSKTGAELFSRLERKNAASGFTVDPAAAFVNMLEMLSERGTDTLFYSRAAGLVEGGNGFAKGLVIATKQGLDAVGGKIIIDCSDTLELFSYTDPDRRIFSERPETLLNVYATLDGDLVTPSVLRPGLEISASMWSVERVIQCRNAKRLDLEGIVSEVRGLCSEAFCDAVFSHCSFSPIPFETAHLSDMPRHCNVFAPLATERFTFENRASLFSTRLAEGERLSAEAAAMIKGLSAPTIRSEEIRMTLQPGNEILCDVLVAGGGTSGALAAIASARSGAKTSVTEALDYLGGVGTGGALNGYYYGLPGGLQDEVDEKVHSVSEKLYGRHGVRDNRSFHPFAKMNVLETMCREAGVAIFFDTLASGVETCGLSVGNQPVRFGSEHKVPFVLSAVETCSPRGAEIFRASVTVDSTGDADIAALSGAEYTLGREYDAVQHIYSIPAIHLSKRVEKDGSGRVTRSCLTLIPYNVDAGYCDACDIRDVSRARIAAITAFDRNMYCNDARVLFFSAVLGARASRQIVGDIRVGLGDQICSSEFPDVIGYAASHYDNHAADYENESAAAMLWTWALDAHLEPIGCEIPFRAMLPRGIENLIVACRSLSLDFDASQQFRMQRDMQRIGEAAGLAAALASRERVTPRALDIRKVQELLVRSGALVSPETHYHGDLWKPAGGLYAGRRLFELGSNGFRPAAKLCGAAENDYTELEKAAHDPLRSDAEHYAAALKLAAGAGDGSSLEAVKRCLAVRCSDFPAKTWRFRSAPFWKIAIGVIGAAKYTHARSEVENVLADPHADQQALILAVRALGRMGDAHSADMIEKALLRTDVNHEQRFENWGGDTGPFIDDSTWKLELAAYSALRALGRTRHDLVEKYLDDPRGYVRRAAERAEVRC